MNSILLAAIVGAALLVAVLLLKKRASTKRTPQIDAVAPTTIQESPQQPATPPPPEPEPAMVQEAPKAAPEEESVSLSPETVPIAEPGVDVAEDIFSLEIEVVPGIAEPEAVVVESPAQAADAEDRKTPVGVEDVAPSPREQEKSEQLTVAHPETEEEAIPAVEVLPPVDITEPEEIAPVAEAVAAPQPAPVEEEPVSLEQTGEPTPVVDAAAQVSLTMEAYSERLNLLEEKQRALLTQAIQRRDDKLRDQLQRELVIMNNKLALLTDSYAEEVSYYQRILEALESMQGDGVDLAAAKEGLREGNPQAAEAFFAQLSEQPTPLAAQAAFHSGQLAECRVDLQQALALYRRAVDREPENPQYLQAAGKTARSIYRYNEALAWLESFVKLSREKEEIGPVDQALAQRELAYTYVLSGQYQKAGPLYKEAMTTLAQQLGQDHPEMATSWYQLGELQETLGEYDKAVTLYKKALEILEKKRGPEHPVLAGILDKLAALCMELEMEKQAVPLYERMVRIREKALRPTHPQLALSLNSLAESYRLQGRYAEAEACYQKSLVINETLHGTEHPSVAAILQELAKLCTSQRKPEEAEQYQQRASAIFQKSVEASERKTGQEALTLEI
jgi:tetratricopeptide (TPR) repeat protein